MAEITVTAALQIINGNFKLPKAGSANVQITQNNPGGGVPGSMTAPIAGADVDLSSLTTLGWVRMENAEAEGGIEVQWGINDGAFRICGRMKPGEPALFRMEPGMTYHVLGVGGPALVLIQANED